MLLIEKYTNIYLTDDKLVTIKVSTKAEKKIAAAVIRRLIDKGLMINLPDQLNPVNRQEYLLKAIDHV